MSDIELDQNCQNALDALIEAEESTRIALIRLEFRYFAEVGVAKIHDLDEIAAVLRAKRDEEGEEEEEEKPTKLDGRPAYLVERDAEERQVIEQEESLLGRSVVTLEEEEARNRLRISASGFELAIVINEAFKPCFTMMYNYFWDVHDYRLLPIKPGALDRVKDPERHLPTHLRKEAVDQYPTTKEYSIQQHAAAYAQTLKELEAPPPPLMLEA